MTLERKFANGFMASSASGNIRVIKFRHDESSAVISEAACGYPGSSRKQALIRRRSRGRPRSIERPTLSAGFANLAMLDGALRTAFGKLFLRRAER